MGERDVRPPSAEARPGGIGQSREQTALGAAALRDHAIAGFFDRLTVLLDRLEPVLSELEEQAQADREAREGERARRREGGEPRRPQPDRLGRRMIP